MISKEWLRTKYSEISVCIACVHASLMFWFWTLHFWIRHVISAKTVLEQLYRVDVTYIDIDRTTTERLCRNILTGICSLHEPCKLYLFLLGTLPMLYVSPDIVLRRVTSYSQSWSVSFTQIKIQCVQTGGWWSYKPRQEWQKSATSSKIWNPETFSLCARPGSTHRARSRLVLKRRPHRSQDRRLPRRTRHHRDSISLLPEIEVLVIDVDTPAMLKSFLVLFLRLIYQHGPWFLSRRVAKLWSIHGPCHLPQEISLRYQNCTLQKPQPLDL